MHIYTYMYIVYVYIAASFEYGKHTDIEQHNKET